MRTVVLGSGAWGCALAAMLADMGHSVKLWSAFENEVESLNRNREHPALAGARFPDSLEITGDISVCSWAQALVIVTPSFAVRETARRIAPYVKRDTIVVCASKGIENETSLCMTQIIEEETGMPDAVALSGASHAEEVARGMPTGCVSACRDKSRATAVQDMFMNPRFRVYASDDPVGVELGGALKNVIALCAGVCDGMGCGDNTKALLMTRGLTEMARLGVEMGGRKETFAGLSGIGDLIVTCTSMHSRNRRAGILIGQGKDVKTAMAEVGAVVEGYYAARSAYTLSERLGVDMPISRECYRVLYEGKPTEKVVEDLMTRSKKHEIEESWI